ncbi:MAG TPA: hypothetical protein P5057_04915, partial [Acidobacteriota bacterium]|nr:hypothetical protein [Acidobacteriota bacterium]
MNRREALKTSFPASVAAVSVLLHGVVPGERRESGGTTSAANTLYVHPVDGIDTNPGTLDRPLRTLGEAARRVNRDEGSEAMTILLSEGVHVVNHTIELKPERRSFSKTARLSVRAQLLPGDRGWDISRMPTLIHSMPLSPTWNGRPDPLGGAANGLLIETSHVSVQGLRILGLPLVETPRAGLKRRLYAIARLQQQLEDLEVTQCLFAGNEVVAPIHVAVIAHGTKVNVHHCVFFGDIKDAVVYWTPDSTGHSMRNCFFHGMYGSTVWTSAVANDFDYRNNVVDGANYVWIYQSGTSSQADAAGGRAQLTAPEITHRYKVLDSWFSNNRRLAGTGTGARIEYAEINPSFLQMERTKVTEQPVAIGKDPTKWDYLHPVAGSEAANTGAGL